VLSVSELKAVRKEALQMKKVLMIVMLIIAMGLVGCPRRYNDDRYENNRDRYEHERDRNDQDRGRDYEGHDRDNHDHEQDHERHK
jgi:hypothetical protein